MGLSPRKELLRLPFLYLRYRLGMLGTSILEEELPSIIGKTREQLEAVAQKAFEEKIQPRIYQDALAYMDALRAKGEVVAIATSSVDIIVQPLAQHLHIADVIATSFEFKDGVCSGKFKEMPNFSTEKKERALSFLKARGLDPVTCSFYSDSIYDLPLLQAVGNPVAVNPDIRLALQANRNHWKILRFSR